MNRREFTLSAAGLAAAGSLLGAGQDIAVGMIGVGGRGSFLLTNVLQVPGVKITHICDIDPSALDKGLTAAARDKPQGIADYRKLLEKRRSTWSSLPRRVICIARWRLRPSRRGRMSTARSRWR